MPRKQGHVCKNCRWSTETITDDGEVIRECRAQAPAAGLLWNREMLTAPSTLRAMWPAVKDEEWCGNFSANG